MLSSAEATARLDSMHDEHYKRLFAFPAMVADLVRCAMPEEAARFGFDTLQKVPSEYVSDSLQRRLGDAVWRVCASLDLTYPSDALNEDPFVAALGKQRLGLEPHDCTDVRPSRSPAEGSCYHWVYLAFEFQSDVDEWMALRFASYVMLLHGELVRNQAIRAEGTLSPAFAIVLHSGGRPWRAPTDLATLFGALPPRFAAHQGNKPYLVVDLSTLEHHDTEGAGLISALAALEQSRSLTELAAAVVSLKVRLEGVDKDLRRAFGDRVVRLAEQLAPEGAPHDIATSIWETDMTLEERVAEWPKQWKQEGIDEGLEMGRELGLTQGREQGLAQGRAALVRLATTRFGAERVTELADALTAIRDHEGLVRVSGSIALCASAEELMDAVRTTLA